MVDREKYYFSKTAYRIAYYEELLLKKYNHDKENKNLTRLRDKLDDWYYHSIEFFDVCDEFVS